VRVQRTHCMAFDLLLAACPRPYVLWSKASSFLEVGAARVPRSLSTATSTWGYAIGTGRGLLRLSRDGPGEYATWFRETPPLPAGSSRSGCERLIVVSTSVGHSYAASVEIATSASHGAKCRETEHSGSFGRRNYASMLSILQFSGRRRRLGTSSLRGWG